MDFKDAIDWLNQEFKRYADSEKSASMRSFAKKIDVFPGRLSEYLSGRRKITKMAAEKILDALNASEKNRESVLSLFLDPSELGHDVIDESQDYVLKNPLFFKIRGLVRIGNCKMDHEWIAKRLKSTKEEVDKTVEIMLKSGFLDIIDGQYSVSNFLIKTDRKLSSEALTAHLEHTIQESARTMKTQDPALNDFSSVVMAMDPERIPEAIQRIENFRQEMLVEFGRGPKEELFMLNIQFFQSSEPVS